MGKVYQLIFENNLHKLHVKMEIYTCMYDMCVNLDTRDLYFHMRVAFIFKNNKIENLFKNFILLYAN